MSYTSPLIEIKISRVIPARRWKVLRMLMRLSDFPQYMPNVKECQLVGKTKEGVKTRWRVEVEGLPIQWTEEDIFVINHSTILFRLIEGDLKELGGRWVLKDHPEGTEVELELSLRIGVPEVEKLIGEAFREKITRNFISMLECIENRLLTRPYEELKKGSPARVGGFVILGHPYNVNHLVRYLKLLDPHFKIPSQDFLAKIYDLVPPYKMYDVQSFKSATGKETHGWFLICPFVPDMLNVDLQKIYSKVVMACKVAQRFGAGIVGLGGFTSIVGERLGKELSEEIKVPVTTGNTYTAALAIEGLEKAAELMGQDLSLSNLTIIGGTGNIGFACARIFASRVKSLTLTGRHEEKLAKAAQMLKDEEKVVAATTTDNKQAIKGADLVIACASVSASIVDINDFKPGTIICDVAYPKNISYSAVSRKDIFIFSGGLAEPPTPLDMGFDTGLPSPKTLYGCFAESIILALEEKYESYSKGLGLITKEKIVEIRQLAQRHGFKLAPFYWGNRPVDPSEIESIAKAAAHGIK
ncbi:MAG: NAD(P)-binding domain-containing protein [Candidatus Omnitrophica bacterium]|nr:NAD(P)-binding domain-containing protein [Candidatus Omnitrophota bacterium]